MNNTNNSNDLNNDNEYVREPDQTRTERLINTNNYNPIIGNLDYTIEEVLEQSSIEYSRHREIEEQREIEQILSQEELPHQNKFPNTKIQLTKLSIFDRPNLYYYELVLSIIEMYNNNYITEYKLKSPMYGNLFYIIHLTRIPPNELNDLKKLIIEVE